MSELQQCQHPECSVYFDSGGSSYCSRRCQVQSLESTVAEQANEIERLIAGGDHLLRVFNERSEEIERLRRGCKAAIDYVCIRCCELKHHCTLCIELKNALGGSK